jgi:hypothetical protein
MPSLHGGKEVIVSRVRWSDIDAESRDFIVKVIIPIVSVYFLVFAVTAFVKTRDAQNPHIIKKVCNCSERRPS